MALIKQVTGNLIGGVSTLAENHRQPNQTQLQLNAEPSISEGLRKRAKTTYRAKFSASSLDAKYHSIFQDGEEEYFVRATTDGIDILDVDTGDSVPVYRILTRNSAGTPQTGQTLQGSDLDYLRNLPDSGFSTSTPDTQVTPSLDFQFVTINDVTFLLNRKVYTDIASVNVYDPVGGSFPDTWHYSYLFIKALSPSTESNSQDAVLKFSGALSSSGQVATYTQTLGQSVQPASGGGTTDYQHARPDLMLSQARAILGGTTANPIWGYTTGETSYQSALFFPFNSYTDPFPTTNQLHYYSSQSGHTIPVIGGNVLPIVVKESVLGFKQGLDPERANYSGGDSLISFFRDQVSSVDELPLECHDGKEVRVAGEAGTGYDDYYLKFVRAGEGSDAFGRGVWQECSRTHWQEAGPDPDRMPHVLIRRQDDFQGAITGTPFKIYFEYGPVDGAMPDVNDGKRWTPRQAGDDDTVPHPSFTQRERSSKGNRLEEMFFYNNRLGFLTKEGNITLSRANDFFNFYRQSVVTLLDSDPIDVVIADTQTGVYSHATPFERELLITGDNSQYSLNNGGGLTSPRTVSVDRVSGFEVNRRTPVMQLESTAVFTSASEEHNQVWQMFREDESNYGAAETTEAVPGYIRGVPTQIATSSVTGMIVVSTDAGNLYCHNYFRQGSKLLQQAWWQMDCAEMSGIKDVFFHGDFMRVVVEKKASADSSTVETLVVDYEPDNSDEFHADYVVTSGMSPTYDATTDLTALMVPYGLTSNSLPKVYNVTDGTYVDVEEIELGATSGKVKIAGDLTSKTFKVGLCFDFKIELHAPILRIRNTEGTSSPERAQRVLVNKMDVTYTDSNPFDVTVESKHRDPRVLRRPTNIVGDLNAAADTPDPQSGVLEVGLHLPVDDLEVRISDTGAFPIRLENIQWEMNYRPRAKTWAGR